MKVDFVRLVISQQTSSTLSDWKVIQTNLSIYIQLLTYAWSKGSRSRVKTFRTYSDVFNYLNRLNACGYLTGDDYDNAWELTLASKDTFIGDSNARGLDFRTTAQVCGFLSQLDELTFNSLPKQRITMVDHD